MENIKKALIQNPYVSLLVKLALLPLLPIVLIFSCLFPCISLPLVYVYRKNIINHIKQDYQKSKELTNYLIELANKQYQDYANIEKVKVEVVKRVNLVKTKFQNVKLQGTQQIEGIIENVKSKASKLPLFDQVSYLVIKSWKFQISILKQLNEYLKLAINLSSEFVTIACTKANSVYNSTKEYLLLGKNMIVKIIWRHGDNDNFGYALINENGTTINNLERQFESKRFAIQLYHYVTSQFWKHKNLNGMSILDLDFGDIDAVNYIQQQMKPKQYIVVSENQQKVDQLNLKYNEENKNIKIEMINMGNIDLQNQKFDIITNIQKINKHQDLKQVYQQIPQLLTDNGHFIVCDYKRQNQWEQFESIIKECGFKVVEKVDITLNVKQAMKLQHKKGLREQNNFISKMLYRLLHNKPREYQQIANREVLYMVYDLQKI